MQRGGDDELIVVVIIFPAPPPTAIATPVIIVVIPTPVARAVVVPASAPAAAEDAAQQTTRAPPIGHTLRRGGCGLGGLAADGTWVSPSLAGRAAPAYRRTIILSYPKPPAQLAVLRTALRIGAEPDHPTSCLLVASALGQG